MEDKQPGKGEDAGESYRRAGPYIDASWQLVGSLGLWTAVGWFLDWKLGTRPWLLVTGSLFGIGLGFYLFFRVIADIGKRKAK
jgi:F0F1-type ATP synthase assembly protein I